MEQLIREVKRISLALFDHPDGLDNVDAVIVIAILSFVNSRPALGKSDKVAVRAIAALAEFDGEQARALISELSR